MNLGIHQALAAISGIGPTERIQFQQRFGGRRDRIAPVVATIERVMAHAEEEQNELVITLAADPYKWGEDGAWKRLTHQRYLVLVSGPVWVCQIYLHALEGFHGHRR